MRPEAFLANAKRALEQGGESLDEAECRAVIHAAYYSAFHVVARELGHDPSTDSGVSHAQIRKLISISRGSSETMRAAQRDYESLRVNRVRADYRLDHAVERPHAVRAVAQALGICRAAGLGTALGLIQTGDSRGR